MDASLLGDNCAVFYKTLNQSLENIKKGERIRILIPFEISHINGYKNWDELEGIQTDYRGSILKQDVFMTLRFDQHDESSPVYIDICHF